MTEASLLPTGVLTLEIARRDSLLEDTQFYAEWLRPQRVEHILMALLAPSADLIGGPVPRPDDAVESLYRRRARGVA